jgi:hypothetical protein
VPSGLPVALGGIDYAKTSGVGTLVQLGVHRAPHSSGIGTILIGAEQGALNNRPGRHRPETASSVMRRSAGVRGIVVSRREPCALHGRERLPAGAPRPWNVGFRR